MACALSEGRKSRIRDFELEVYERRDAMRSVHLAKMKAIFGEGMSKEEPSSLAKVQKDLDETLNLVWRIEAAADSLQCFDYRGGAIFEGARVVSNKRSGVIEIVDDILAKENADVEAAANRAADVVIKHTVKRASGSK